MSNPFILAAENSPNLLPLLRENPTLAPAQDEHGYSLLHAAASYNHLDLLRSLITEFQVDINLRDEDGETCLFVVETVEAAKVIVEEGGGDIGAQNEEGITAEESIEQAGDFPFVATYLRDVAEQRSGGQSNGVRRSSHPPPLPPNVRLDVGSVSTEPINNEDLPEPDPEFKRRIEELASRDDFHTEEGQRELRGLVADAVRGVNQDVNDRDVRRRLD